VFRGLTTGGESPIAVVSGLSSPTYIDTNVANGTTYFYTVKAVNSVSSSVASTEVTATPTPVPVGVVGTGGDKDALITWAPFSSATGYNVYRSTTSGSGYTKLTGNPTTANAYLDLDSTLTDGTTYYYVVTAIAPAESAFSSQVTVTPVIQNGTWSVVYTNSTNSSSTPVTTSSGVAIGFSQNGIAGAAASETGVFSITSPLTSSASTAGQWSVTWSPSQPGALPTLLVLNRSVVRSSNAIVANASGTATVTSGTGSTLATVTYPNSLTASLTNSPVTTTWATTDPNQISSTTTSTVSAQQAVTGGWSDVETTATFIRSAYTGAYFAGGGSLAFTLPATSAAINASVSGSSTNTSGQIQAGSTYTQLVTAR